MVFLICLSLAAYTTIALLFKGASSRTRPDQLVVVALTTVTLLAGLTMLVLGEWGGSWAGAVIALLSGGLFYLASIYRVRALADTPVSLVFAVTNLDLVVSGAVALLIPAFGQLLSPWHLLAVGAAALAILTGTRVQRGERISANTFVSLGLLAASATGFVIYARFFPAALLFFILLDHLAGVLLNGKALRTVQRPELGWGALVGVCMFVGFWSLLQALALSGDHLTFVLLVLSMKTPFIALLSVPIFHERFSRAKLAAISLATLALVLWEVGSAIG
jgi:hypothetical protein